MLQARAQEHRSLVGCSGDFTSVAEVARIQLWMFEKPRRPFQPFSRPKGTITADFSGISL
jgi:hypothetical protein